MIKFLKKHFGILFLFTILIILILTPFIYGRLLSNDKLINFTGLYSLYQGEMFYYMALGPTQVNDGYFFFEDRFDRVGEGYYFLNIIGVIIYFISIVFQTDYSLSFLIYKIISSLFLLYFLNKIFIKINAEYTSILIGLVLTFFSSGMSGWISNCFAWDTAAPEMNIILSLTTEYYLPAALGMIAASLYFLIKFIEDPTKTNAIKTGIAFLILGIIYIYSLLILMAFSALYFMYRFFVIKTKKHVYALIIPVLSLPVIVYYVWLYLFVLDDNGREDGWIDGPTTIEYLLTYLPQLFLLLVFIIKSKKNFLNNSFISFSFAYIIFQFLLSRFSSQYFPFVIQSYVGLSLFMSIAFVGLMKYVQTSRIQKAFLFLFVLISSFSNLKGVQSLLSSIKSKEYPVFITKDEMLVYDYINKNIAPRSKVCVCNEKARILAYYTNMFVTYDVIPDDLVGNNKRRWQNLNTQRGSIHGNLLKDLSLENCDYLLYEKMQTTCGLNKEVYEKIQPLSSVLYFNNNFELLFLKNLKPT